MKHTALALLLFTAAIASAHAGDATASSRLRCGLLLGGKTLTYDAGDEQGNKSFQRVNAALNSAEGEPLRFAPAVAVAEREADSLPVANDAEDSRLPINLTLATLGCSW